MTLRVVLEYDEVINSWAAYCPEMPGINSCGATQEEAATNFKEAAELFFEPSDFLVPEKSKVLQVIVQMPVRLTAKQVISVLKDNGFELTGQKGSHQKWHNSNTDATTIVPVMEIIKQLQELYTQLSEPLNLIKVYLVFKKENN